MSADRLADILWGDQAPDDPAGAVQTHVSRLRTLLEKEAGPGARQLLATQPPGSLLLVDPLRVDANRFERQVGEARSAPTPRAAAELLERALGLWRGPALAEFDHAHLRAAATRLEELRLTAVELRAAALLAMHRDEQVVSELEGAVAPHPLREHLRHLQQAILRQADELPWPGWAPGTEPQPSPSQTPVPDEPPAPRLPSLPEPLTSFVGRDVDVGGVIAALANGRIVVLTGAGGVGKSRLALHVARALADDYPDGVDLCDLVDADGPGAVADVVATRLGALPTESVSPEAAVIDFLRTQRRLAVFDACEHVLTGASELVQQIGRWCPAVDVLATSQRPLDVAGQQVWPAHRLAVGDGPDGPAVTLFRDRAAAADPTSISMSRTSMPSGRSAPGSTASRWRSN